MDTENTDNEGDAARVELWLRYLEREGIVLPKLLTLLVFTAGLAPAAGAADSKPAAKGRVEGQVLQYWRSARVWLRRDHRAQTNSAAR